MSGVFAIDILSDLMNLVGCRYDSVVGRVLVQSEVSEKAAQHSGRPITDHAIRKWCIGGWGGERGGKMTGGDGC